MKKLTIVFVLLSLTSFAQPGQPREVGSVPIQGITILVVIGVALGIFKLFWQEQPHIARRRIRHFFRKALGLQHTKQEEPKKVTAKYLNDELEKRNVEEAKAFLQYIRQWPISKENLMRSEQNHFQIVDDGD